MDMDKYFENASVLAQALPYIQNYRNKTVVIKYGGNAMINDGLKAAVINNIVLLSCVGINVVLVHGGGPEINDMLRRVNKQSKFVNGLRYTDEETMDIVQMVLCGKVNKELVSRINRSGGKAVGLCGLDGGLLQADVLDNGNYGLVGEVYEVNTDIINASVEAGYMPVVATVAGGKNGEVYNINADLAAAKIAAAIGAEKLILLTDVRGILHDPSDESSLISVMDVSDVPQLMHEGVITGGMIPKVNCCVEAVRRGVKRAHIIDGRLENSILIEMLSDAGIGTMILQEGSK